MSEPVLIGSIDQLVMGVRDSQGRIFGKALLNLGVGWPVEWQRLGTIQPNTSPDPTHWHSLTLGPIPYKHQHNSWQGCGILMHFFDIFWSPKSTDVYNCIQSWQVTFDSYLYKTVQGNDPVGDLKLGWKTLSSLYKYNNQKTPDPMRTLAWAWPDQASLAWYHESDIVRLDQPPIRSWTMWVYLGSAAE